ncbi:MAG: PspC domain-containing protein [Prevotellaceae bacterium]|jgi:phage shock protein PspC (stress-responsive transcriptional regulator)|nr:PspC domain-containing protein [Prevotellaceae bacterium]
MMTEKKLTKSNNKMIAGICAGLAEYFGWEISITRVVYALLSILTAFSGVIVYLILWLIIPNKQ